MKKRFYLEQLFRVMLWHFFIYLSLGNAYADENSFPESYVPQFDFYVDQTGEQTIQDIMTLPETVFKAAPKVGYVGGYNRSVHWLRFQLRPLDSRERVQVIRINPPYLDKIVLYFPTESGRFEVMRSGELFENWANKEDRAFVFRVPNVTTPKMVYIRMETINTHTLVAEVYSEAGYHRSLLFDYSLSGIYIGLLLSLIVLNIGQNKWRTERVFRHYLLFLFASLAVFLSVHGWWNLFASSWQDWMNYLPQITTLLYLLMLTLLYYVLFEFNRQQTHVYFWISVGYIALTLFGFMSLVFDFYIEWMPWYMPLTMLYLVMIAGFSVRWALQKRQDGGLLFLAVAFGFTGVLGTALSLGGVVSGGELLMYSYTAGTLGSIMMFQGIMNRRLRQIEAEHLTTLLEKEHVEALAEREKADKEQKAQFISMLSHELKTPLSVIRMGIGGRQLSESARHHIEQAIGDMSLVIDRCAVLEKVDDQVLMQNAQIDLNQMLQHVIAQSTAPQRVKWRLVESLPEVSTDEDWLRVVLSNLLDNALKYSPLDSFVQIEVLCSTAQLCVSVKNTPHADLPDEAQLFQKYYRAKSAHQRTGSGLGLYIVKRLVDQIGATIEYQAHTEENKVEFKLCLDIKE